MKRILSAVLTVAGLGLVADSAQAQAPAARPPARAGVYYYPAGRAYTPSAGYSSHNGVLRGPSGAMSGRARPNWDPTGRPVQLYKPWLQPIR